MDPCRLFPRLPMEGTGRTLEGGRENLGHFSPSLSASCDVRSSDCVSLVLQFPLSHPALRLEHRSSLLWLISGWLHCPLFGTEALPSAG